MSHRIVYDFQTGQTTTVQLTPAEILQDEANAAAQAAIVPPVVSRAQGRIWLHRVGKLAEIQNAIDASVDVELKIWWSDAAEWRRDNVYIVALGAQFQINLDVAFREAAQI